MRLIDADALEKFLSDAEMEATKRKKYVLAGALNVIQGNVRNFPTIEPERKKGEWIPVSEGPPEESCRTLVTTVWGTDDRSIEYLYYFTDIGWGDITDNVIAWMPPPEPFRPKEE